MVIVSRAASSSYYIRDDMILRHKFDVRKTCFDTRRVVGVAGCSRRGRSVIVGASPPTEDAVVVTEPLTKKDLVDYLASGCKTKDKWRCHFHLFSLNLFRCVMSFIIYFMWFWILIHFFYDVIYNHYFYISLMRSIWIHCLLTVNHSQIVICVMRVKYF